MYKMYKMVINVYNNRQKSEGQIVINGVAKAFAAYQRLSELAEKENCDTVIDLIDGTTGEVIMSTVAFD